MATSTSPGASPTKMIWASLFPEPGTGQNACPAQRRVQCVQSQRACHSDIRRGGRGFTLRLRCMVLSLYVYKVTWQDRKSTRLNSSHQIISYAVFCLKKKI